MFAVQYTTILYYYLREWWKNPHCSLSCCLALLLPLNDLQGQINGLASANVLNNQMQSGQMDAPNLIGAVKDSGAIDVSLKEGEQDDDTPLAVKIENGQDEVYNTNQSHKSIQTETYTLSITVKDTHMNVCEYNIHQKTRRNATARLALFVDNMIHF